MPPNQISVLIVDDHRLFREALRSLLQPVQELRIAGEAGSGAEAQELVLQLRPDVVLMDIVMPGISGIEAARWIREHPPRSEVLFLTGHHNETYQRQAFEAGARGYLLKSCSSEDLLLAIRHAARGDYFLTGEAGREVVEEYIGAAVSRQRPGGVMTQRERELAILLADGYSTKEAASVLGIAVKTAETHRASILRKLGARNVAEVVRYCIRNRLIEP